MHIINLSLEHAAYRDELLQKTLRPNNPEYSITREYPVLLAKTAIKNSYAIIDDEKDLLAAHAHYWPRILEDFRKNISYPVALIGNVASDPLFRGQGLMRRLIEYLSQLAEEQGRLGLFLWSDLLPFYEKLGFKPFGRELRIGIKREAKFSFIGKKKWQNVPANSLSFEQIKKLIHVRYPVGVSLDRSDDEFIQLLSIPDTVLLCDDISLEKPNYCIIGKGYDLIGVVHEWGMQSPEVLFDCVQYILHATSWSHLVVLAPDQISPSYLDFWAANGDDISQHHLALYRPIGPGLPQEVEGASFFWGLDSI